MAEEKRAHIFVSILINREMNGTKGAPANLLLDDVLVDPMLCRTVILTRSVLRTRVESFLSAAPSARSSLIGSLRMSRPSRDEGRWAGGVGAGEDSHTTESNCDNRENQSSSHIARNQLEEEQTAILRVGKNFRGAQRTHAELALEALRRHYRSRCPTEDRVLSAPGLSVVSCWPCNLAGVGAAWDPKLSRWTEDSKFQTSSGGVVRGAGSFLFGGKLGWGQRTRSSGRRASLAIATCGLEEHRAVIGLGGTGHITIFDTVKHEDTRRSCRIRKEAVGLAWDIDNRWIRKHLSCAIDSASAARDPTGASPPAEPTRPAAVDLA